MARHGTPRHPSTLPAVADEGTLLEPLRTGDDSSYEELVQAILAARRDRA
jgi:hypothetical protein